MSRLPTMEIDYSDPTSIANYLRQAKYARVDQDNYMLYASDEIQQKQEEAYQRGQSLTAGQQMAIVDTYKQLAGQNPTWYNVGPEGVAAPRDIFGEIASRRTSGSGWENFKASLANTYMQAAGGITEFGYKLSDAMGITEDAADKFARQLEEVQRIWSPTGEGFSSFAGELVGNAMFALTLGGIGGGAATAETAAAKSSIPWASRIVNMAKEGLGVGAGFGVSAAGGKFAEISGRRRQGQDISTLNEWTNALGTGAVEMLTEAFGWGVAKGVAKKMLTNIPGMRAAIASNGVQGFVGWLNRAAKTTIGATLSAMPAGAAEEALAQIGDNLIDIATGVNKEIGTFSGVGRAALAGAVQPLLMGFPQAVLGGRSSYAIPETAAAQPAQNAPAASQTEQSPEDFAQQAKILTQYAQDPAIPVENKDQVIQLVTQARESGQPIDALSIIQQVETPAQETAPTKKAGEENPYLRMPIERVARDAEHGVSLAKEALVARQISEAEEQMQTQETVARQPEVTTPKETNILNVVKQITGDESVSQVEPVSQNEKEVASFAQDRGLNVVFVKSDQQAFNGFSYGDSIYVRSGQEDAGAWEAVAHEIAHAKNVDVEQLAKDKTVKKYMKEYLQRAADAFGSDSDPINVLLEEPGRLEREGVAYMIGQMFRDPAVRAKLQQNKTLWSRIVELVNKFTENFGGKNATIDRVLEQFRTGKAKPLTASEARQAGFTEAREKYGVSAISKLPKMEILKEEFNRMASESDVDNSDIAVVAMDMANFKAVNDLLGENIGDKVLGIVGDAINETIRLERGDVATSDLTQIKGANKGGDEFQVLIKNPQGKERQIINRLKKNINQAIDENGYGTIKGKDGEQYPIFISAGYVTRSPSDSTGLNDLLSQAVAEQKKDKAAMKLKRGGSDIRAAKETKPARKVAATVNAAFESSMAKPLSQEEAAKLNSDAALQEFINDYRQGKTNEEAMLRFMASNMDAIHQMASARIGQGKNKPGIKLYTGEASNEELIQAGVNGFMSMFTTPLAKGPSKGKLPIETFDPAKTKFITFATNKNSRIFEYMRKAAYPERGRQRVAGAKMVKPEVSLEQTSERTGVPISTILDQSIGGSKAAKTFALEVAKDLHELITSGKADEEIRRHFSKVFGVEVSLDSLQTAKDALREIQFLPADRIDPKEVAARLQAVLGEKPKVSGRPELANPQEKEVARRFQDLIDQIRKEAGRPAKETRAQWAVDGQRLASDSKEKKRISRRIAFGQPLETAAESEAAKIIIREKATKALASGDTTALAEAVMYSEGWRMGGTEVARVLASRADELKRPGQRLAEYAAHALTTLPENMAKTYNKAKQAGNTAEAENVAKTWSDEVKRLLDRWKEQGITIDQMENLAKVDSDTRWKIVRDIQNITQKHGPWTAVQEYYRNMLMFSPLTIARNMLGGFYAVADIMSIKPIQRIMKSMAGSNTSGQTGAALHAMFSRSAWSRALNWAKESFVHEMPVFDLTTAREAGYRGVEIYSSPAITGELAGKLVAQSIGTDAAAKAEHAVGKIGKMVRLPQRINMAVDQMVKAIHAHAEVAAQAVERGKEFGFKPGSRDMIEFVENELHDLSSASWTLAMESGETARVTFQAQGGKIEDMLIEMRKKVPALGLIFPFIKTPIQIAKQAALMTPLGAGRMAYRAAQAVRGKQAYTLNEITTHAAQQLMAWVGMAMIWDGIGDDEQEPWITGPAIYGRQKQASERYTKRQIYPPMSIRIGDKWYSYKNIEPFSTMLGALVSMGSEFKSVQRGKKPTEGLMRTWTKLRTLFTDQTYLRTISDLVKMWEEPQYYGDRALLSIASSWLPNVVDQGLRATDEYVREKRPMGEPQERASFMDRVATETLPSGPRLPSPKVDIWGNDIKKEDYDSGMSTTFALRMLVPTVIEKVKDGDVPSQVLIMLNKWNEKNTDPAKQVWFVEPPRTVQFKTGQRVPEEKYEEMNAEEYHDYCKLAGLLAKKRVMSTRWDYKNPNEIQVLKLKEIISDSRSDAREFIKDIREARFRNYYQRAATIQQRMKQLIEQQEG